MKKLAIVWMLLQTFHIASAQTAKWDSTFRPNNYELKKELFQSFPDKKSDIVFLGNSITANVDWIELLQINEVRNRGISGDITFGVLERLNEVIEGQPSKVFILIGINDISRNIPDSLIVANHRKMVERIKKGSPRTKIYLQTLLPVNNTILPLKNHYNKDEHIQFVNDKLKETARELGVTLIDLHPHFKDAEGRLNKDYTQDGLHLTAAGYKVWAELLKKGNYLK